MAQWTLLLFSLCGVLHDGESQPPTLLKCCQDGRDRALRRQDCAFLPLISPSHTCRIAQERCCDATVVDKLCDKGVQLARSQGACEMAFFKGDLKQTQISKICCDCCMLGLTDLDSDCELQGLSLGKDCEHTAKICCGNNTEKRPNAEGSSCSQLRTENGSCVCHDGYQLQDDGVKCKDINECLLDSHNCVSGQTCINTDGSFRCQRETGCGTGYELRDNNSCQDIDECALGTHNCGQNFTCTNTAGSFRCRPSETCTEGFIQDAIGRCIDVNECVANTGPCLPGHTCINTDGSFTCRRNTVSCARGYHLNEDGTRCEDVDECHTGNVCGIHGCVNLVGSYRCECRIGFVFNSITKLCEDINECMHYPGRLCAHKCKNTEGSYLCSCTTGFRLSHDNSNCEDVNECEANPCSQECSNVYGSYQCYCRHGYQLSDINGITCDDIDECALLAGGQMCSYNCSNAPGSFYCTCPSTGYTLSPDGRTCQDIDECAAETHNCSVSESCFNVQGGFRCLSLKCPQNFRQASPGPRPDVSLGLRCIKDCPLEEANCSVHIITYSILSLPYFVDFSAPEEIVWLQTVVAAYPADPRRATDVYFEITSADEQFSFDVEKRFHQDKIMGVVRQVKPIIGPRYLELKVAMNYVKSGTVSHQNVVVLRIFISEFWF
nr:PREDICTED: fibulin-1-like isoform X1 [Paralichthys olivaceus]